MSSHSYYVPSPIELANNRIAALEAQLDIGNKVKREMLARMSETAAGNKEARVQAQSFGELAIQAASGIDIKVLAESSDATNLGQAVEAAGVIDFIERFGSDVKREEQAAQSAQEYLNSAKARVTKLIAFSSIERATIRRFTARCDELAARGGLARDVQPFIEDEMEQLCSQLGEADSANRMNLYLDYLALCLISGESPSDLTYAEMKAAVERMQDDIALRAFHEEVSATFDDALEEVGLTSVGTITLDEERGSLVVDDDGGACALFVSETEDGAFVFTTISANDPQSMTPDEQFATRDSARRLCEKKDRLLTEALARRGIATEVKYEYPVDLRLIEQSDDYAQYLQSSESGRRRGEIGYAGKAKGAE